MQLQISEQKLDAFLDSPIQSGNQHDDWANIGFKEEYFRMNPSWKKHVADVKTPKQWLKAMEKAEVGTRMEYDAGGRTVHRR